VLFRDRRDAGRALAAALGSYASSDVVTVGLPRGGVPVAFEVAHELHSPLDVVVVRKLGLPSHPELAMGAVGEDGAVVVNDDVVRRAGATAAQLSEVHQRERANVALRASRFRGDRPRVPLEGRTVIVVDDGIATGSTARVACHIVRAHGAAEVVLAVPVAPQGADRRLRPDADDVVCVLTPDDFSAVGQFYADFSQIRDHDVAALLERAEHGGGSGI
jgi:predicted phosphoribosyltransferase